MTGSSAVTRPPGDRFHSISPPGPTVKSTGSRLATTTRSNPSLPVNGPLLELR
ncbi:Uncharacterised protein [Mycobacteroides abscessus]|nr:Uncharacterised protein [Mycobacteroides abscessus]